MLNDNAKAWVAALRSGKYKQAVGVLTEEADGEIVGHCCLGVACELAVEAGVVKRFERKEHYYRDVVYGPNEHQVERTVLPPLVAAWLGLREANASFPPRDLAADADMTAETPVDRTEALTSMNDAQRSFEEIADVIEQEPPGLFVS
jgi:hypothetical protein